MSNQGPPQPGAAAGQQPGAGQAGQQQQGAGPAQVQPPAQGGAQQQPPDPGGQGGQGPQPAGGPPAQGGAGGGGGGGAPNPGGQGGQGPGRVFRPPQPKFGGVEETGVDVFTAWTGGKPRADWTALDNPNPSSIDPNQYRSNSISGSAKSKHYRTSGLDTKLNRESEIHVFQKDVWNHLVEFGLDAITYMEDPFNTGTEVVSVIFDHARFDYRSGVQESNAMMTNTTWDRCDLENIRDAKRFLLNSLDEDLKKQLCESRDDEDSFAAHWLNLIHIIKSASIDRFDKIKDRIKRRKLSDYAGENIESIASDYLKDWKELHGAGLCDQNLTMKMLSTIMSACNGSEQAETFRFPLRTVETRLNKELLAVRHMGPEQAHQHMVNEELDVTHVAVLHINAAHGTCACSGAARCGQAARKPT